MSLPRRRPLYFVLNYSISCCFFFLLVGFVSVVCSLLAFFRLLAFLYRHHQRAARARFPYLFLRADYSRLLRDSLGSRPRNGRRLPGTPSCQRQQCKAKRERERREAADSDVTTFFHRRWWTRPLNNSCFFHFFSFIFRRSSDSFLLWHVPICRLPPQIIAFVSDQVCRSFSD